MGLVALACVSSGCIYDAEGVEDGFGPGGGDQMLTPSDVAPKTHFTGTGVEDTQGTGTATTGTQGTEDSSTTGSVGEEAADESADATESSTGTDESESSSETGGECIQADYVPSVACSDPIGTSLCSEGHEHLPPDETPTWMHNPPHSGPHHAMSAQWGVQDEVVDRANWVENLHDGGIVLLYNCPEDDPCPEQIAQLERVVNEDTWTSGKILLAPDPELDPTFGRFAAVSWTWVYRTPTVLRTVFNCFVQQHFDQVPEKDQEG